MRSPSIGRWFGYTGIAVGVIGWISAFRNVAAAVGPIADVNNYLLPLWLIVLGIVLIRWRTPETEPFAATKPPTSAKEV